MAQPEKLELDKQLRKGRELPDFKDSILKLMQVVLDATADPEKKGRIARLRAMIEIELKSL